MMAISHQERTASDSARESPLDPFACFHGSAMKQSIRESYLAVYYFCIDDISRRCAMCMHHALSFCP